MRQVDQKDEAQKHKQHGSSQGEVFPPDLKECLRYKKRQDDENQPEDDLGSPIAIL